MGKKIGLIITIICLLGITRFFKDYLSNYYLIIFLLIINTFVAFFYSKYFVTMYFFFLSFLLLFRKTNIKENTVDYFANWISIVFKNKTVFINVFGNIFLFIPLGFALKDKAYMGIIFSIIMELLQKVLKRGVLDYYDILLNSIGIIIGLFIWEIYIWMIKIKKKKKLKRFSSN